MALRKKYDDYHDLYMRTHPNLSKQKCHEEVNLNWNSLKEGKHLDEDKYETEVEC